MSGFSGEKEHKSPVFFLINSLNNPLDVRGFTPIYRATWGESKATIILILPK
jgi:hypothetical protein